MTTVWDLIFVLLTNIIMLMKSTDFFYGISVWQFSMVFFTLSILSIIIATLTGHKGDDKE